MMADALLLDTEAAVMSSFAFLEPADVEMDDEDYMGDDMDMVSGTDADMKQLKLKTKGIIVNDGEWCFVCVPMNSGKMLMRKQRFLRTVSDVFIV